MGRLSGEINNCKRVIDNPGDWLLWHQAKWLKPDIKDFRICLRNIFCVSRERCQSIDIWKQICTSLNLPFTQSWSQHVEYFVYDHKVHTICEILQCEKKLVIACNSGELECVGFFFGDAMWRWFFFSKFILTAARINCELLESDFSCLDGAEQVINEHAIRHEAAKKLDICHPSSHVVITQTELSTRANKKHFSRC